MNFDDLGGCPRIAIFSQIKAFLKNKHSHIVDITSIIFQNNAELGEKDILGLAPRRLCEIRKMNIQGLHSDAA